MDITTFDEMYGTIKDLRKELGAMAAERNYYKSQYEQLLAECHFLEEKYYDLLDDVQLNEMRVFNL